MEGQDIDKIIDALMNEERIREMMISFKEGIN